MLWTLKWSLNIFEIVDRQKSIIIIVAYPSPMCTWIKRFGLWTSTSPTTNPPRGASYIIIMWSDSLNLQESYICFSTDWWWWDLYVFKDHVLFYNYIVNSNVSSHNFDAEFFGWWQFWKNVEKSIFFSFSFTIFQSLWNFWERSSENFEKLKSVKR